MATVWYDTWPQAQRTADAVNSLKAQIGAGSSFHLDAYENPVASAAASSLATAVTLVNELRAVHNFMMSDTLSHKAADVTDPTVQALANPNAADGGLAQAIALANDMKAKFNTHIASTTYHYNADATNTIVAANAADLPTLETLINAMKTSYNAHLASAPTGHSIRVLPA